MLVDNPDHKLGLTSSLLPVGTLVENQLVIDKRMISTKVPSPSFQLSILGQLGINVQNNEVGPLPQQHT